MTAQGYKGVPVACGVAGTLGSVHIDGIAVVHTGHFHAVRTVEAYTDYVHMVLAVAMRTVCYHTALAVAARTDYLAIVADDFVVAFLGLVPQSQVVGPRTPCVVGRCAMVLD